MKDKRINNLASSYAPIAFIGRQTHAKLTPTLGQRFMHMPLIILYILVNSNIIIIFLKKSDVVISNLLRNRKSECVGLTACQ
jgi:hypothetical protein